MVRTHQALNGHGLDLTNIEHTTQHEIDAVIDADPMLIAQMLDNLIDNALRYTPSGGVVTVRCGPSSPLRSGSSSGEPILKLPAGMTTISGQVAQSRNA